MTGDSMTGQTNPNEIEHLFNPDPATVAAAVRSALQWEGDGLNLPAALSSDGMDAERALSVVAPYVRGGARDLGHPGFLAHMDPPTPWVSWVATLLAASSNQNLLHPDTAPAARTLEQTVVGWLAPMFAMAGGHLVPGSTVANLTALWAARDLTGATTVVASPASHLSIRKAAAILGLDYVAVDGTSSAPASVPWPSAIVVVTAGTTGTGAIESLEREFGVGADGVDGVDPAWVHVDAAWAGPLRFSDRYRARLAVLERADSVSVSAHKWLYQPKESALVLFKDLAAATEAISVDGAYLAVPNVGLLGSHGATAAPLAATLLSLGRRGVEALVEGGMTIADRLVSAIEDHADLELFGPNVSGVVAWRHRNHDSDAIRANLHNAFVSTVVIDGVTWLRSVAANPLADPELVVAEVLAAADRLSVAGDSGRDDR